MDKESEAKWPLLETILGTHFWKQYASRKAAYTASPGVLQYLSLLNYTLCERTDDFQYIVNHKFVKVHPVGFSNDETALKSSIQFDEDCNVNLELKNKDIDLNYCRPAPFINNKTLKNEIICEAVPDLLQHFTTL